MEIRQVEKRSFVGLHEFEKFMTAGGEPLIIENWMANWQAMSKWDFPFFRENFGHESVEISPSLLDAPLRLHVRLADFIDYIEAPNGTPLQRTAEAYGLDRPFYAYSFKPFKRYPALKEDFALPPFVEDWFDCFAPAFRRRHFPFEQGWVLLGPAGTISHMHQDAYATIAWLAQVRGRKRCWFFSPQDSSYLYNGRVDPQNPDHEAFPNYHRATLYEAVLEPGTMVFLPPRWWHHVVALEPSITVSYNIVNQVNLSHYLRFAYGSRVTEVLGLLPDELRPRDESPPSPASGSP